MTGIERLREVVRELGRFSFCYDLYVRFTDIADQIEREWDELRAEVAEMRTRLMPEGGWPRYEDGEMVFVGSDFADGLGETHTVTSVEFFDGCVELHWNPDEPGEFEYLHPGERVRRPAPKVLDADGAEIRVGDTVYRVGKSTFDPEYDALTVTDIRTKPGLTPIEAKNSHDGYNYGKPEEFTHHAPVLAADGRPLREGETVWLTDGSERHVVLSTEKDAIGNIVTEVQAPGAVKVHISPSRLTHERPDSWERLEEDAETLRQTIASELGDYDFDDTGKDSIQTRLIDLVRRAKVLAGGA